MFSWTRKILDRESNGLRSFFHLSFISIHFPCSKMRSDSLRDDPRAQVLVAPPGINPADYTTAPASLRGAGRRGGRGGRGGGRRGRRGGLETRMDTD